MMKRTPRLLILVLALIAAGALAVVGVLRVMGPAPRTLTSGSAVVGKAMRTGTAAIGGPFTLVSTNGENVTDQSFRGKWLLIFFGYTSCPDLCPTALANVSAALEKFGPDTSQLQPLFITVDPQRDTREVMADYLKSFDSRILGLTGTKNEIDKVIKEFHLFVAAEKSNSDENNYYVSHSSYIYLIDPRGSFVNVIHGGAVGDDIAIWLRKEIREAGS